MRLKAPQLTDSQLNRLSEFCSNTAVILFAGLILPVLSGIDKVKINDIILGASSTAAFLIANLILIKRNKRGIKNEHRN